MIPKERKIMKKLIILILLSVSLTANSKSFNFISYDWQYSLVSNGKRVNTHTDTTGALITINDETLTMTINVPMNITFKIITCKSETKNNIMTVDMMCIDDSNNRCDIQLKGGNKATIIMLYNNYVYIYNIKKL